MLSEPLAHSDWTRGEIEHLHWSGSIVNGSNATLSRAVQIALSSEFFQGGSPSAIQYVTICIFLSLGLQDYPWNG